LQQRKLSTMLIDHWFWPHQYLFKSHFTMPIKTEFACQDQFASGTTVNLTNQTWQFYHLMARYMSVGGQLKFVLVQPTVSDVVVVKNWQCGVYFSFYVYLSNVTSLSTCSFYYCHCFITINVLNQNTHYLGLTFENKLHLLNRSCKYCYTQSKYTLNVLHGPSRNWCDE